MRKIIITLALFISFVFTNTYWYEINNKDKTLLINVNNKIDLIYIKSPDKIKKLYKKVQKILDTKLKWKEDTRIFNLINEINIHLEKILKINMQTSIVKKWDLVATMITSEWIIKIKLFKKITPNTVNNFSILAQKWYYDETIFHRVINNFMIQGGDPTWSWMWWNSIYWESFDDEFSEKLKNIKYSISMVNSWPKTNWSQFFINQVDNNFLDNKHTVFWQVIEWEKIVDKIAWVKTLWMDKPEIKVEIKEIIIEMYNWKKLEKISINKDKVIKNYKSFINK
jgi:cyclophilin family peptidyl-prolyl cis-trans isomerase